MQSLSRPPNRVHDGKLIFSFLNQTICCGYSKELSQWDGSFEHPKHMFKLLVKKITRFFMHTTNLILTYDFQTNEKNHFTLYSWFMDITIQFINFQYLVIFNDVQNSNYRFMNLSFGYPILRSYCIQGSSNKEWDFCYSAVNYHARLMKYRCKVAPLFGCSHVPYSTCYIVPIFVARQH